LQRLYLIDLSDQSKSAEEKMRLRKFGPIQPCRKNCSYLKHRKSKSPQHIPNSHSLSFSTSTEWKKKNSTKCHTSAEVTLNQHLRSTDFNSLQIASTGFNMMRCDFIAKHQEATLGWITDQVTISSVCFVAGGSVHNGGYRG
jgi:hypothetical protein